MKLSQIEKRIPQTLTNSKDIIQTDREYARRSSRARSTRGQENEAWALYKKFHPGSPEVTFLGTDTSFAQSHPTLLKKYLIEGSSRLSRSRFASSRAYESCLACQRRKPRGPHSDFLFIFHFSVFFFNVLIFTSTFRFSVKN